jgi:hypothetical protein
MQFRLSHSFLPLPAVKGRGLLSWLVAPQASPAVSNGQAGGAAVCAGSCSNHAECAEQDLLALIARTRCRHGTAGGDCRPCATDPCATGPCAMDVKPRGTHSINGAAAALPRAELGRASGDGSHVSQNGGEGLCRRHRQ